ncbi:hypothetical protein H0H92_004430 [Tricholoma furcatifolium]|nr:hypothetical protein H0H92_004430 [Tricholoma furcatifolium]
MTKVSLNGTILAESNETVEVENNQYFPPSSVNKSFFSNSNTKTASYYDATVDGKTVKDIAWYYPKASEKAKKIEGYIAFYKNKVQIE